MLPPAVRRSPSRHERSPRVRDDCVTGCPPDLLSCVLVRIGLRDLALADPARQPCIRFLYVGPPARGFGFLQIPPPGGHPCRTLRFRSPRPAEELHLLNRPMPGTRYILTPLRGSDPSFPFGLRLCRASRTFVSFHFVNCKFPSELQIRGVG